VACWSRGAGESGRRAATRCADEADHGPPPALAHVGSRDSALSFRADPLKLSFGRMPAGDPYLVDKGDSMEVQFRRVGARRYAVVVIRPGTFDLEMNPAPGYDDRMPHDLLHFVVERELGLGLGVFGQVAAGGTAGTFRPVQPGRARARDEARRRRELTRRSSRLLRAGQQDCEASERAAHVCLSAWMARRRDASAPLGGGVPRADALTAETLTRVCDRLDELSAAWAGLELGQALALEWPG
jgi:hypothetical protein